MTYTELDQQLQGRNRERRKLANSTYAERRGEGVIAIKLHATDILRKESHLLSKDGKTAYTIEL